MSNSHSIAYYWSHAGAHFEIREEGDWWATVPSEDWPADGGQKDVIISDFDLATTYGDRRQEIVFIGAAMDQVLARCDDGGWAAAAAAAAGAALQCCAVLC